MRIKLTSVFVDDQEKALKFYTEVLGFVKKTELPTGDFISRHAADWRAQLSVWLSGLQLLLSSAKRTLHL